MSKKGIKTTQTKKSVKKFLNTIEDPVKKDDANSLLSLMEEISNEKPYMWGESMIGFGKYHYKYESGHEGEFFIIGFSPRKQALTIYIMPGYQDFEPLLKKLGPHKKGKSCLYIKRVKDIHLPTLKKIIQKGYDDMKKLITSPSQQFSQSK